MDEHNGFERNNKVMFTGLSQFGTSNDTADRTDWDSLDYTASRDKNWYRERFPGFEDEIISILVQCDGMNRRSDNKPNEWEKRQAVQDEIKKKLTIVWD